MKSMAQILFLSSFHKCFNIFLSVEGAKEVDSQWEDLCHGLNGPLLPVGNDCGLRSVETWMYLLCKSLKVNPPTLILITKHYAKDNMRCIVVGRIPITRIYGVLAKIHLGCI
jgi:hypothetical protein